MTAQRYVLVAWPPTKPMQDAGWIDKEDVNTDEIFEAMCATSLIAADDPAEVERVVRVLQPGLKCTQLNLEACSMNDVGLCKCLNFATAVLRLWSPVKP